MMFLFAYLAQSTEPRGWPVELMYATEHVLAVVAFASLVLALALRRMGKGEFQNLVRGLVATVGGVSAGVALIMPLELAPFFFDVKGEAMLGTMVLILFYPVAAIGFFLLLQSLMPPAPARPPRLPAT